MPNPTLRLGDWPRLKHEGASQNLKRYCVVLSGSNFWKRSWLFEPYADWIGSEVKKCKREDFESIKPQATNNWNDHQVQSQDNHVTSFSQLASFWWFDHDRVSSLQVPRWFLTLLRIWLMNPCNNLIDSCKTCTNVDQSVTQRHEFQDNDDHVALVTLDSEWFRILMFVRTDKIEGRLNEIWEEQFWYIHKNYLQFNRDNPTVNFVSFRVCNPKEIQVYCIRRTDNSDFSKYVSTIFMQFLGLSESYNPNPEYTIENPK